MLVAHCSSNTRNLKPVGFYISPRMRFLRKDRAPPATRGRAEWSHVSSDAVGESYDGFSHTDRSPRPGGTTKTVDSCDKCGSHLYYNGGPVLAGTDSRTARIRGCSDM